MSVRGWLWLSAIVLVPSLACGGGSSKSPGKVASGAAAQALTDGLTFEGGVVKTGGLPDASNQKVTLDPGSGALALKPSESMLMPLDITNPDEDTDPVAATLLQFGDSNSHVEIPRKSPDGAMLDSGNMASANGVVHLEVKIGVGTNICKDLCLGRIQVKMLLAALLESGAVGQHAMRDVELDCTDGGDASKCPASGSADTQSVVLCETGQKRCAGNGVETCSSGKWSAPLECTDQACVGAACKGECTPGAKQCNGLLPQTCSATGSWQDGQACASKCSGGACVKVPSVATDGGSDAGMPKPKDAGSDAGTPSPKDAGPSCIGGGACEYTANACHEGIYACDSNHQQVCQDNGPKTNGAGCGADHVCFGGACVACKVGDVCDTSHVCAIGTYDSCANGPHCASVVMAPDGMTCGTDQVCSSGACVACQQDAPCTPTGNDCHNGVTDCSAGPVCNEQQANATDGTACKSSGGRYCKSGACVPCNAGDPCVLPSNPCRVGQIACGVFGPSCSATGGLAQDGTGCGQGQICMTGSCVTVASSWTLTITGGDNQMKRVDEVLAPVTLSVTDGNGAPVANVPIDIAAPLGAYAPPTALTNGSGIATVVARLGRALGQYTFTASSAAASASLSFRATAIAPARGTIFNVVSQSHVNSQGDGLGGPATMAHINYVYSVASALDGTLYLADTCSVYSVTPAGIIARIAGTGTCGSSGGDIGAATSIELSYPYDLALDETRGFLYIADSNNQKVRLLDLANGTMETYAGGGTTTAGDYGDNQLATLAVLSNVTGLSLDKAGNLYIGDTGHNRIRKVDTSQVITTFMATSACSTTGVALYSCGSYCNVAWDANGQGFVSGDLCGAATANNGVYGIARIEQNGGLTLVAGSASSSTSGENVQATSAYFSNIPRVAFDTAGNLFLSVYGEERIRRIDAVTGIINTIAGDGTYGYKGDYIDGLSGTSAEFYYPYDITFDRSGNLYVADWYNSTMRAIWGVGDATSSPASMTISAGDGQSTNIDALFTTPLGVTLKDGNDQPIAGASVSWQAPDAGAGLLGASSTTTLAGIASMNGRPGLAPGAYHFTARYLDIHGRDATGSPAMFTVNATAPASGSIFTIVNTDHASGSTSSPLPGTFAHTGTAAGVAVGSDGTVYIGESCQVSKLSPQGLFTPLAGNGSCAYGGDGGRAMDARLSSIQSLALDEANPNNRLLYINDAGNSKIRVVTLDTNPPAIDTFVGYTGSGSAPGSPNYGVPGPGTGVNLGAVYGMALNPADHKLYLVETGHNRILQVDSSGNVASWLTPNGSCTGAINLYSFPGYAQIVWAPGGVAYISAYLCGTDTASSAVYGVLQRAQNGTLTRIAGQNNTTGNQNDGTLATNTYFPSLGAIALGPGNTSLFVAEYGQYMVRQISALDGSGTVTTVAGSGSYGFSGDYGPATSAQFYEPWSIAFTPSGHMIVADYYNYAFREIW